MKKKSILLVSLLFCFPLSVSATESDKQFLQKMSLEEFAKRAENSRSIHDDRYIAQAQSERASTIQKLYELSQDRTESKIVPMRGGSSDKLLGLYLAGKTRVIFNSGYKDVDPRTQCEWAYDLHKFIVANGGGWDNHRKYLKETTSGSLIDDLNESARSYQGGKNPNDPTDRAHVPYDKQAAFADKWWSDKSQAYKTAIVPPKDWWTNDAVLDGNNLWTRWEQLGDKGSSDYGPWREAELATLMQKR